LKISKAANSNTDEGFQGKPDLVVQRVGQ
jgi:hypothetical protein